MPENIIGRKIEITEDKLREIVYFIIMKFQADKLHMQGTSSKRDLLGGYIERWFNKVAESIVFEELLKSREYDVVPDYFIYDNESEKNAPDIIGLEKKGKAIPFVKYNNGTWETVKGMPRIEVKTIRQDQYLLGVREPQMIDDYYAFIESDLSEDYLAKLFDKDVLDDEYLKRLETSDEFIESDAGSQIIPHQKYKKPKAVGTFTLLGIYTKEELKKSTVLCGKKESPLYFISAENCSKDKSTIAKLAVRNGIAQYKYQDNIYLPFHIEGNKDATFDIMEENKTTFYFRSKKALVINGSSLDPGCIKIKFKIFERSSSWVENVCTKDMIGLIAQDSTKELISLFDGIVKSS